MNKINDNILHAINLVLNTDYKLLDFDINNIEQRQQQIKNADIVISMLPANMHIMVAKDCVSFKKSLVTASYVSPAVAELDESAKKAGILLLNEIKKEKLWQQ